MFHKEKISVHQFAILVFMCTIGSAILLTPEYLARIAKQDAWIATIFGTLTGLIFILVFMIIGRRYADMTIMEYCEKILGKWLGKFVSLLYIFYFFTVSALMLREISYFITMQIMPETPITAVHILFICIVVYAVRLGLEVVARSAEIFLPWVFFLLLILIAFLIPETETENIQPFFEGGAMPVIQGTAHLSILTFLQLFFLLMLFPNVNSPKKIRASFLTGASIGGIVLFLIALISILVLGAEVTARHVYPSFILAKQINIADFITRIEVLMAGIWFLTIFFKLTLSFYVTSVGLTQTLNLKNHRILTFPLAIILVVFATMVYPDLAYFDNVIPTVMITYTLVCGLFFPLLLLAVDTIRNKITQGKKSDS